MAARLQSARIDVTRIAGGSNNRSACSLVTHLALGLQDVQGRLHFGGDVPARPVPVLSRSNRVLTLRCILRCTTAKSAHLRSSYPVEGTACARQPHRCTRRGPPQVLPM